MKHFQNSSSLLFKVLWFSSNQHPVKMLEQKTKTRRLALWFGLNLIIFIVCYLNYRLQLKHRYLLKTLNVSIALLWQCQGLSVGTRLDQRELQPTSWPAACERRREKFPATRRLNSCIICLYLPWSSISQAISTLFDNMTCCSSQWYCAMIDRMNESSV